MNKIFNALKEEELDIKVRCRHCNRRLRKIETIRARYFYEPTKKYFCINCLAKLKKARVLFI